MPSGGFHIADYVVFGATLIVSMGIGLFFAFKGRTKKDSAVSEYLVGGRKMNVIPIAISLFVSFLSTIGIMGHPAEVYAYGTQFMFYMVAILIGLLFGTFVFVPLLYPLKITSIFEYHEMRYQAKYIQGLVITLAVFIMLLLNGILIFSPCVAFQAVSGFPAWASIIISGLAGVAYTTLGGMKAVVWTDVFQAIVIFAGLITIVIKGTIESGGIKEVWKVNAEWDRITFFDFSPDPTKRITFWSVVLLNSLLWMAIVTTQTSVQRFMALPSIKKAKMSTLFIIPGFITSGMLTCVTGVTAFAYYAKKGCDPMSAGKISSPNEIIAYFVMDVLDIPSLPGLFVACLFSASLSSVSSTYNAMAAICWQNVLKKKLGHLPPNKQANVTKLSTLIVGLLSIGTGFLLMEMGGTLIQITYSVVGAVGGPLLGINIVSGLLPRVGPRGIFVGTLLSVACCLWLSMGATLHKVNHKPLPGPTYNCSNPNDMPMGVYTSLSNSTEEVMEISNVTGIIQQDDIEEINQERTGLQWFYSISYFYYPAIGIFIVTIVSLIFSCIPGLEVPQRTPKKLLFECVRPFCGEKEEEEEEKELQEKLYLEEKSAIQEEIKDIDHLHSGKDDEVWVLKDNIKMKMNENKKNKDLQGNSFV